jgi:hypothetical protein
LQRYERSEIALSAWADNQYKLVQEGITGHSKTRLQHHYDWCRENGYTNFMHSDEIEFELYELVADPGEKNNMANEHPEIVEKLRREYIAWYHDVFSTRGKNRPVLKLNAEVQNPNYYTSNFWLQPRDYKVIIETPGTYDMGDPNGGFFHDGWYHIFYGLQPFAWHPGAWYWAQARSKDMLHWEHMDPGLAPDFDLGLGAIGSGATIQNDGKVIAFHSQSGKTKGGMKFWQAQFTNNDLSEWKHGGKIPALTLEHPGLPPYDGFWRDPYVFNPN